jgi:hypothetical protein
MQLTKVELKGRRWYKGPDGRLYPSASSVLDILFPGSKDWISEDALARGTMCHEEMARALVARAGGPWVGFGDCDEETQIRTRAVLDYLDKFQLETVAVESPTLFLDIGMTPDYVAKETHPQGGWIKHLFDWKFAEVVTDQYFFQVELYGRAEQAQKVTILQCNRKGEVFPHRVRPDPERWELIKSAINVRQHIDKGVHRHV